MKKRRRWTEEELAYLVKEIIAGKSRKNIAKDLQRPVISVVKKAQSLGMQSCKRVRASRQDVIEKIHKRVQDELPINYQFVLDNCKELYGAARSLFGNWKNAIVASGIDYELLVNSKKYKSLLDNVVYDSYVEGVIGGVWFLLKGREIISHYRVHSIVTDSRRWTCDFVVNENLWIEYDGLGNRRRIQCAKSDKVKFYQDNDFDYVIIRSIDHFRAFVLDRFNVDVSLMLEEAKIKTVNINMKKETWSDLARVVSVLNKFPTKKEYNALGVFNAETVIFHHEKWSIIAQRFGVHKQRGQENNRAKLTEKEVIEIDKQHCQKTKTINELAKQYSVNYRTISAIVNRTSWSYLWQ